jgi:hypothetical protein
MAMARMERANGLLVPVEEGALPSRNRLRLRRVAPSR